MRKPRLAEDVDSRVLMIDACATTSLQNSPKKRRIRHERPEDLNIVYEDQDATVAALLKSADGLSVVEKHLLAQVSLLVNN